MSNRLIGRLPTKVGIRPVIDGRERGVRESLEKQTMNLAKTAANLVEENLRFPSGEKIQCVIAPTTIGGVADAAVCAALKGKVLEYHLQLHWHGAMEVK